MKVLRVLLARAKRMDCLVKCNLDNASFKATAEEERSSIAIALVALLDYADSLSPADRVRLKRLPACSEMELEDLAARWVRTSAGSIYVGDLMTSYREGER